MICQFYVRAKYCSSEHILDVCLQHKTTWWQQLKQQIQKKVLQKKPPEVIE